MAAIEWMVLCESAFFDETGRLCLVGIAKDFPLPSMPLLLHQHVPVARIGKIRNGEDLALSFMLRSPSSQWINSESSDAISVRVFQDYLLMTLRNLPLREEGIYRFELSMNDQPAAAIEIPVWLVPNRSNSVNVH